MISIKSVCYNRFTNIPCIVAVLNRPGNNNWYWFFFLRKLTEIQITNTLFNVVICISRERAVSIYPCLISRRCAVSFVVRIEKHKTIQNKKKINQSINKTAEKSSESTCEALASIKTNKMRNRFILLQRYIDRQFCNKHIGQYINYHSSQGLVSVVIKYIVIFLFRLNYFRGMGDDHHAK